ncbi:MAG: hypothetical protein US54_C0045G0005 [Candidatus Roizmanbacteria bacterium GW2011_GWA2_37_7]|uniref:Uncharacterized protein n=1 Tax=Candidatus Roizmanbacteria bacterium GW2011_GWA2_37_7 TaxID=1618481 RepID=A0A0G0JK44_9BACT|nr:MAG: hypothetical protein US54_C0045G0005 [Candidatus Roizmanbacteria bacterium GW2011_GWA2_37_7]
MKRGPIIFILFLLSLLVFILGVQYGKTVNIADEALRILLSITPSPSPAASQQGAHTYKTYSNKLCGISFLYPDSFLLQESSSEASLFTPGKQKNLTASCSDNELPTQSQPNNVATRQVKLQQFSVVGHELKEKNSVFVQFSRKHPYNNQIITITVTEGLLPLIEKTFEFTRPS